MDRYKHIHEKSRPAEHKRPLIPENQWVNIEEEPEELAEKPSRASLRRQLY